jgi:hypothetical protein
MLCNLGTGLNARGESQAATAGANVPGALERKGSNRESARNLGQTGLKYLVGEAALPVELLLRPLEMVVNIDYRDRVGQTTMRPLQSSWWTLRRILTVRFS